MYHYTVDDMKANGCTVCCCEPLALKPGSTSKVHINYAPWAVPIGRLHCLPTFDLQQMETCTANPADPVKTAGLDVMYDVPPSVPFTGDLADKIEDPATNPLTFRLLPLYGPKQGPVTVESNGSFTYVPPPGYNGPDRFFVEAKTQSNHTKVFEVLLGVGAQQSADMNETPHVYIDVRSASVDYNYFTASFAVSVAPTADLCEVWRLTVMMNAIDCECICYNRTDCYDIRLIKC